MNTPFHPDTDTSPPSSLPGSPRDGIWAGLIGISFVVSMALAYRPTFGSLDEAIDAALPWLVLAGMVLAWAGRSFQARLAGILIAIAAWCPLVIADDRWTILSFALFGLCFIIDSTRLAVGLILAAIVSVLWTVASIGGPSWTLLVPMLVFSASATIAYAIERIGRLAAKQADLITELESTRGNLAASERSRGALEERTRLAGEIHDTLAQGFTSIVLLARAGKRSPSDIKGTLDSIEATAQENLDTARRLVESSLPDELERVSLPDAVRRHLARTLPDQVDGDLEIVGKPVSLPGSVETVLLRAAQEGIRNACMHAKPHRIDVTLSYLDGAVALRVSDDGNGLGDGDVHDRGTLTGGQGLQTLTRRVESLRGRLTIEPGDDHGAVLTVLLPVGS